MRKSTRDPDKGQRLSAAPGISRYSHRTAKGKALHMARRIRRPGSQAPITYVEAGTAVLIDTGLLQGVRGTILGSAGDDGLIVMVRLLRETTALELPACCLRIDDGLTDIPQPLTH
jgi:hypothetical protein